MPEVYKSLVDLRERAKEEVSKVVLGQDRAVDLLLVAALSRGHVLLEGPPGSAKTLSTTIVLLISHPMLTASRLMVGPSEFGTTWLQKTTQMLRADRASGRRPTALITK